MWKRFVSGWLAFAAVTCSVVGIVLLFFPLGYFMRFGWPVEQRLAFDAGLSFLFFLQHSGMVRRPFRRALRIPEHYWPAVYAASSGIALIVVCLLWQSTDEPLIVLGPAWRMVSFGGVVLAIAVFAWGVIALGGFDMVGLRALRQHVRGVEPRPPKLMVRGPYRWVRHPLYSAILLVFWINPDPTLDRLLFNVLWTAWIVVGVRLEDRDLEAEFGEDYARYRRRVPGLVPWRKPARI